MSIKRRSLLGLAAAGLLNNAIGAQSAASRSIVVYFSRTGCTKRIAELISRLADAELVEIVLVDPYPESYSETTTIVKDQMQKGVLPDIKPLNVDFSQFDTIYLGSPTWWGHIARPVEKFLADEKFSGKTIKLFTSHGGSGRAGTQEDVERLCPQCRVSESLVFYGSSGLNPDRIAEWIGTTQ